MQEIRIPRKAWIVPVGIISSIALLVIAMVVYNAADGPQITSPTGVRIIALLLLVIGVFAVLFIIREVFFPRHLIINSQGITNQFSFGLVTWDNIKSVTRFEGTIGGGRYRSYAEGLKIEVKDKDVILRQVTGLRRWNLGFASNRWGSVAVIYSSNWSWSISKIEEAVQNYLTEYGEASKASNKA